MDVLVVDPGELGELLTTLLQQYGLDVARVLTGEDALTSALEHRPTVVVVEAELADTSGLDIAELCATELGAAAVLTYPPGFAAADPDVAARIRAMSASFVRPFRSLSLIETVARLCGRPINDPPTLSLSSTEGYAVDSLADDYLADDTLAEELVLSDVAEAAIEDAVEFDLEDDDDEDFIRADPDPVTADTNDDDFPAVGSDAVDIGTAVTTIPRPSSTEASRSVEEVVQLEEQRRAGVFTPGDLADLWERTKQRRSSTSSIVPSPASEGRLTPRVLADVLDAFHQSQTTGELWLEADNGRGRRVLLLQRGIVVGARSNIAGEDLLSRLLKRKALSRDDAEHVAFLLKTHQHKTVVEAVVDNDLVEADVLKSVVDEQVRRIAIGAFSWSSGSYRLSLEGRATKEPLPVTVHVGDVVVHAIMLTESDAALKKAAPDDARFAPVGDAVYGLEHLRLTPAEARVVIAMDGTKTIADLLLLMSPTSERVVRGLAAGLQCLHLAKFMGRGAASARKISFF